MSATPRVPTPSLTCAPQVTIQVIVVHTGPRLENILQARCESCRLGRLAAVSGLSRLFTMACRSTDMQGCMRRRTSHWSNSLRLIKIFPPVRTAGSGSTGKRIQLRRVRSHTLAYCLTCFKLNHSAALRFAQNLATSLINRPFINSCANRKRSRSIDVSCMDSTERL